MIYCYIDAAVTDWSAEAAMPVCAVNGIVAAVEHGVGYVGYVIVSASHP